MSRLAAGQFYGEVRERISVAGAVLSRLRHSQGRRLPAHTHGAPFYSLLLRGSYRERWQGGEIDCRPLSLVFHPPETHHADELGPDGGAFFIIELNQKWSDLLAPMPSVRLLASESARLVLQLYGLMRQGERSELAVESILLDLFARTAGMHECVERGDPPWLDRMVERIRAEFADPPAIRELAREAGVHPVHMARTFRRKFGMTIAQSVHRLRVDAALRSMASASPPALSTLALQTGFADQSHFTRVFKGLTGSSPGELARLMRN